MTAEEAFPDRLSDGVIVLRAIEEPDWRLEQELSRDQDVVRFTTIPPDLSEQDARDRVLRAIERRQAGEVAQYALERSGRPLGVVGIAREHTEIEVFYALVVAGRGAGNATRAVTLVSAWAAPDEVVLLTAPDNKASQRTASQAGFLLVGKRSRPVRGVDRELMLWRNTR
jgi:RimJ/RimL family protein N-acetyltransferase